METFYVALKLLSSTLLTGNFVVTKFILTYVLYLTNE